MLQKRTYRVKMSQRNQHSIMLRIGSSAQIPNVSRNNADNVCQCPITSAKHANKTNSIKRQRNVDIARKPSKKTILQVKASKLSMMFALLKNVKKLQKKLALKFTNASIHALVILDKSNAYPV